MDNIHAAIGIEQLKKINDISKKRKYIASLYQKKLSKIKQIKLPCIFCSKNSGTLFYKKKWPNITLTPCIFSESISASAPVIHTGYLLSESPFDKGLEVRVTEGIQTIY